ncbi:hypothetical protein CEXT_181011 [Caerostris extrusa]|uniref:Uncharacterized protein n=1 Tax=Caerostris extrusa TaxID=172846 RepID=A0AAV4MRK6_CAEEX|nr:hypothetical protein CEXT_181011 [Caerostris extrusa]
MDGNFPKTSRIIIICYLFHQLHPLPCSRSPTDYMGDSFHCSVFLALGTPRNVQCRQFTLCPLSPVQMSLVPLECSRGRDNSHEGFLVLRN